MWFVWDGKARQGPFSEAEICRRLTMGQWPLSVWVRPEGKVVFRPALWMVQEWVARFATQGNSAVDGSSSTFLEETRVSDVNRAALDGKQNSVPFKAVSPPPQFNSDVGNNPQARTFTSPATVQGKTVTSPTSAFAKKPQTATDSAVQESTSQSASEGMRLTSAANSQEDPFTFRPDETAGEESTRPMGKPRERLISPDTAVEMAMARNNVRREAADTAGPRDKNSTPPAMMDNLAVSKAQLPRSRFANPPPAAVPSPPPAALPSPPPAAPPSPPPEPLPTGNQRLAVPSTSKVSGAESKPFIKNSDRGVQVPLASEGEDGELPLDGSSHESGETPRRSVLASATKNAKKMKPGTQKPLVASEGSVNLLESSSATQIRLRRVNPTAPRRKNRSLAPNILSRIPMFTGKGLESKQSILLLSVVSSLLFTLVFLSVAYFFFFRKTPRPLFDGQDPQKTEASFNSGTRDQGGSGPADARGMNGSARSEAGSDRTDNRRRGESSRVLPQQDNVSTSGKDARRRNAERSDRTNNERKSVLGGNSPEKEKSASGRRDKTRRREMAARKDPYKAEAARPNVNLPSYFSSSRDIERYLQTTNPDLRGFVFIGPVTVIERPSADCQPCLGRGRLQDGTFVLLRSVLNAPWDVTRTSNVVFVRGFVYKAGTISINVNSMSKSAPR